jgi:glycosyltransferase involved in cell wall biosynthesis
MRILHVINSLRPAGAERHLANLLGPLDALGVENHLLTFVSGNGFEDQVRRYVRRAEIGVGKRNVAAAVRMARDVDVVHTQLVFSDIIGRTAAAVAGTPSVTTVQTSVWAAENREHVRMSTLRYQATRLADAATARLAEHHFAVSTKAMRAYVDGLGVPADRMEVITNTVDLTEFDPSKGPSRDEARVALGFAPEEFGVVALARLIPLKALDDAVRAVSIVSKSRPVRMVIAGEGPEKERLEAIARELRAPVTFPGRRAATHVLKGADLFMLPSCYEGMPLSLIEAMAMGVPGLCSNIPENTETGGDAAVYAKVRDVDAYARAIVSLAADPERRAAMSQLGMSRARAFSADAVAKRFLVGVERVLEGWRARHR